MTYLDLILDAVEVVLDMEVSEEAFADAVKSQACLMAGVGAD